MRRNRFSPAAAFVARSVTIFVIVGAAHADRCFAGQFSTWLSSDYAVLMEANSTLNVTGSSPVDKIYGNVGFGDGSGGEAFIGTGATGTIVGHQPGNIASTINPIDFAGTSGTTYTPGSLAITPTSTALTGVSNVTAALTQLNSISTSENIVVSAPYNISISAGSTLNLSNFSTNDGNGNFVFDATIASNMSSSFGGIFDILGSTNQTIVLNIAGLSPTLEGVIQLGGPTNQGNAILAPNVVINFVTPGNTFTLDTDRSANKLETEGVYLDPNGTFNVTNSRIFGLLVGSGSSTFDTSEIFFTPEPSGLILAAFGIACLAGVGGRRAMRKPQGKLA